MVYDFMRVFMHSLTVVSKNTFVPVIYQVLQNAILLFGLHPQPI